MDFVWLGVASLCWLAMVWLVRGCEKLQRGR
jgi:hypothetical protein